MPGRSPRPSVALAALLSTCVALSGCTPDMALVPLLLTGAIVAGVSQSRNTSAAKRKRAKKEAARKAALAERKRAREEALAERKRAQEWEANRPAREAEKARRLKEELEARRRRKEEEARRAAEAARLRRFRELLSKGREAVTRKSWGPAMSALVEARAIDDTEEVRALIEEARPHCLILEAERLEAAGDVRNALELYEQARRYPAVSAHASRKAAIIRASLPE